MQGELLQAILDIVFQGNLFYLSPILFLLCLLLFGEKLIDLIYSSVSDRKRSYR
jgi:hypothetical protein